jgi:diacylglycerol kinase family enzyme
MIASELDLPFACVPAGTRNDFALDLGVDRDDVVGALDALLSGGERWVDLAEVNGRVFVNNVCLGMAAGAAREVALRGAAVGTRVSGVGDAVSPGVTSPTIRWRRGGREETGLAVVVSNNRYRLHRGVASRTRPRLDSGALGVMVVRRTSEGGAETERHTLVVDQWSTPMFTIESDRPVPAGIDGEAVQLDPPLRFRIRPHALRVRIARDHPGASWSTNVPSSPVATLGELITLTFRGTPTFVSAHGADAADRAVHQPDLRSRSPW